jgi:glutaminase A
MEYMEYGAILTEIYKEIQPFAGCGEQASYIPALKRVNPDQFGISLDTLDGGHFTLGDSEVKFSIQSISKVFSLAAAFSFEGDGLWERMGKEPSGTSFNSLVQLEYEKGKPRNPLINAGAIVTADILLSRLDNAEEFYLNFVRSLCGVDSVQYNTEVAQSEQSTGYLNAAIANLLKYHGNIRNDIQDVLRLYFKMCSVEMSCSELSKAFMPFADHNRPFIYGGISLTSSQVRRINAIMQTCGFYDEAGEFSFLVGLPGKSGVGGGIAAICPSKYSIATWSPRLNDRGNSILGMKALELFTTKTCESIF